MKPKRNFIAGKIMLLVIFLCNVNLNGQDIIIKNNGDEIKSKVIEIDSRVIKYRAFDNVNGPLYYDGLEKLDRNLVTLKFLSHEKIKKNI